MNEDCENTVNIKIIEPITKSNTTYKDCFINSSISSNEKKKEHFN